MLDLETVQKSMISQASLSKEVCVVPFSCEGGINLFGDHRGSNLSNRAEISQEG